MATRLEVERVFFSCATLGTDFWKDRLDCPEDMAVKTSYRLKSHSFSGTGSAMVPVGQPRLKSHSFSGTGSAMVPVGQPTSYTSLRDLMPHPAFFACYNRKEPQLLDLQQLRIRDRLVEQAARAYLHPESNASMNRQRSSAGFYSFLRIITVPFQQTHSLLQALFHDASTWLRRMYVTV